MPLSTKPPGPRTGHSIPGCYAAPLADCGGRPSTLEQYVSKALLLRFGNKFHVDGPDWAVQGKYFTEKSLRAKVLCERHNGALSPLDRVIGEFYDVLSAAHRGRVGIRDFDGEDLERWALKVMLGVASSGSAVIAGKRERAIVVPEL